MTTIPEAVIRDVIEDVAKRLGDPRFISSEVDRLSLDQPSVIQYVVAHKQDLELEEIMHLLFLVAVVQRVVSQAAGRALGAVSFAQLDAAATATPDLESLARDEPDMASYIFSNLDMRNEQSNRIAGEILAHVGRALVDVAHAR